MNRQSNIDHLFRTHRRARTRGAAVALHAHDGAQLIFAVSGTMQVYTTSGRWLVPPQLAVWVPGRVPHRLDMLTDIQLWTIYWDPAALREWVPSKSLDREFALRVTPLLRELIFATFEADAAAQKKKLAARLILHELTETPDAPTFLPLPTSAIGKRVADLAIADAQMRIDVGELASRAATSARTISRIFPAETGLSFKAWRQRARIVLTIDELYAGNAISQVAARAGFASSASYSFAFRQVTGMAPTAFVEHSPRRSRMSMRTAGSLRSKLSAPRD